MLGRVSGVPRSGQRTAKMTAGKGGKSTCKHTLLQGLGSARWGGFRHESTGVPLKKVGIETDWKCAFAIRVPERVTPTTSKEYGKKVGRRVFMAKTRNTIAPEKKRLCH